VDAQIGARFVGIGNVFPAYSIPVIEQLEFGHWVALALAYDDHVAELEQERARMRNARMKGASRGRS